MIKRFMNGGFVAAGLVLASALAGGCATSVHDVDYAEQRFYSGDSAGNMPFVEMGRAHSRQYGPVWETCDQLVNRAVADLRDQAETAKADTIKSVRWANHASGERGATPMCTTRWGWFAALGVGGLHPWVRIAEVEGRLVQQYSDSLAKPHTEEDDPEATRSASKSPTTDEDADSQAEDLDPDTGADNGEVDGEGDQEAGGEDSEAS